MLSVLRRVAILTGVVAAFTVAVGSFAGCGNVSPFTSAGFNANLIGLGGGTAPIEENENSEITDSVCDLDPVLKGIMVAVVNQSQQYVRFSMTFVASAGPGGWVCDSEIQNYINAGYSDALIPGSGNTITIGCDTVTLLSGNRLLTMEFGINQGSSSRLPPAEGDDPDNLTPVGIQLIRRDSGSQFIPLPETIVFGNSNANFICSGGSALGNDCSQRGFVYSNQSDQTIGKAVDASRIQGTMCNANAGTLPEWRLDKTVFNTSSQPYFFPAGGSIVVSVLDRASDPLTTHRNQAVWLVTDAQGETIHYPISGS